MLARIRAALDWLRITNGDGKLSLTNCAVFVAFYAVARSKGVGMDWAGFAGMVAALTSYQVKRALVQSATTDETIAKVDDMVAKHGELVKKVQALATPERIQAIRDLAQQRPNRTLDQVIPGNIR
jgi:hypothetical protein